jgi:adenylate cyclase class 2
MSYEVELKFRVADHAPIEEALRRLGSHAGDVVIQSDAYLAHPARDFAVSGEALRLRCDGPANRITYKGPKHGGPTKTREELEVPLASGAEARACAQSIFARLGFRQVAEIHKRRTPFHLDYQGRPVEVALDSVDQLGAFVEIETIVAEKTGLGDAQQTVLALAKELGLSEPEVRSYLRMFLERLKAEHDRNLSGRT